MTGQIPLNVNTNYMVRYYIWLPIALCFDLSFAVVEPPVMMDTDGVEEEEVLPVVSCDKINIY